MFFHQRCGKRLCGGAPEQLAAQSDPWPRARAVATFPVLIKHCARRWQLTPEELAGGSRRESVAEARAVVSYLAVRELGLPIVVVAQDLCVSPTAVRMAVTRGEAIMAREGITFEELPGGSWRISFVCALRPLFVARDVRAECPVLAEAAAGYSQGSAGYEITNV